MLPFISHRLVQVRVVITIQNYLTKWSEAYAVADHNVTTVAKCFANVIWRQGVQCWIIHDCVAEFLSNVIQETAQVMRTKQLPKSGGHPQIDGLVKRLNRTLKHMLSKMANLLQHFPFMPYPFYERYSYHW